MGGGGENTAIHLNKDSYIEIPVEWHNAEVFTLAMWVNIVIDYDNSMYSIMSFNTDTGWKCIYYYPYHQTGFANGIMANGGTRMYGKENKWYRLNVQVNPKIGVISWTWDTNYYLGQASFGSFGSFTDISAIRIGPHTRTDSWFDGIAIDNLILIYDENYPLGAPYNIPSIHYQNQNSFANNLFIGSNKAIYGIERNE